MKLRHKVAEGLFLSVPFLMFGIVYMSGSYSTALLVGLFLSVPLLTFGVVCASGPRSTAPVFSSVNCEAEVPAMLETWKSGTVDAPGGLDMDIGSKV
ncbi:MAG: hypothetical protein HKL84_04410 [Acidimicrobiaceae bacterium]|nr:hypothetical protein [Acidimicrobiaceae bacterium]